jgi:hypothetical protein
MRHSIETVVEPPSEKKRTPGAIVQGEYEVVDSMLYVYGADSRLIGTVKIAPGDDVVAAARRLLRTGRAGGFYDRIRYRPLGLV